ncbi:biopolymer transporter ExbD [Methylocaldum sp.]|uniref:ExbD/TolR family protein n=1 Tax=Methylocaldum sp. TaxID=1969727 RepID=UPI002D6B3300|nr:biopolymer transporter ExbD [Methylocaldum sp.]HYE33978.1 biopolymer transporter ExbD [Methylocaldum sp.]
MDRDIDQINVIPLVDVMLVLLVIILTTATFIVTGQVPVDLAEAKQAEEPNHDDPVLMTLKADGSLFLGETPIPVESLGDALSTYPKERLIVLRADRAIVLEKFVQVVDGIKSNGFPHVSLEVERAEPAS